MYNQKKIDRETQQKRKCNSYMFSLLKRIKIIMCSRRAYVEKTLKLIREVFKKEGKGENERAWKGKKLPHQIDHQLRLTRNFLMSGLTLFFFPLTFFTPTKITVKNYIIIRKLKFLEIIFFFWNRLPHFFLDMINIVNSKIDDLLNNQHIMNFSLSIHKMCYNLILYDFSEFYCKN